MASLSRRELIVNPALRALFRLILNFMRPLSRNSSMMPPEYPESGIWLTVRMGTSDMALTILLKRFVSEVAMYSSWQLPGSCALFMWRTLTCRSLMVLPPSFSNSEISGSCPTEQIVNGLLTSFHADAGQLVNLAKLKTYAALSRRCSVSCS